MVSKEYLILLIILIAPLPDTSLYKDDLCHPHGWNIEWGTTYIIANFYDNGKYLFKYNYDTKIYREEEGLWKLENQKLFLKENDGQEFIFIINSKTMKGYLHQRRHHKKDYTEIVNFRQNEVKLIFTK